MSPNLYSGTELDLTTPVWHPALEYSRPPLVANQNYVWPEGKCSSTAVYQQSVTFPPIRPPVLSLSPPSVDIAWPTTDAEHLGSQSVPCSPEMIHLSHHTHHRRQQVVLGPAQSGYKYEYVSYPGTHVQAAVVPGYYYSPPSAGYHNRGAYPVYSPYAHMQSATCIPSYVQPYSAYLYGCSIDSPQATRINLYVPYTPISSNPSSGNTSYQFESLDAQYEYKHIRGTNGTQTFLTPITPTILH